MHEGTRDSDGGSGFIGDGGSGCIAPEGWEGGRIGDGGTTI